MTALRTISPAVTASSSSEAKAGAADTSRMIPIAVALRRMARRKLVLISTDPLPGFLTLSKIARIGEYRGQQDRDCLILVIADRRFHMTGQRMATAGSDPGRCVCSDDGCLARHERHH